MAPPPKPMRRVPTNKAGVEQYEPEVRKAPPKPVIQKSLLADETPPFETDDERTVLDKQVEAQGSPYGMNSGKKRRLPSNPKNADDNAPKIPLPERAAYVAYLRMSMAGIQIKNVLSCLSHAPGVDKELVQKAYDACMKAADGPFVALGMDREFNLLMGDRRPETTDIGFQ